MRLSERSGRPAGTFLLVRAMAQRMRWGLLPADSKASNPQQSGRGGCGDDQQWGGAVVCGFVCLCCSCLSVRTRRRECQGPAL